MSGFVCDVELSVFECGKVSLYVGPMEPGEIKSLLEYMGASEEFRDSILDRCAEHIAAFAMRDFDDA
jgi:hypothetical protein